jgi:predicted membrane channel-forming protein YqfA (hemolysin III family)
MIAYVHGKEAPFLTTCFPPPALRRLVIGIYVLIVFCVIIPLLGLLFYSGFLDFPFEGPLPRRETI